MKIIIIGDIVGRPGRKTLQTFLEKYENNYDFIIVNGENAAGGFGITSKIADEFLSWGVDVISGGNHSWDKKEIPTINDITDEDALLIGKIYRVIGKLAKEFGIDKDGYRVVSNCNEHGGQTVFHIHFHLIGGEKLGTMV